MLKCQMLLTNFCPTFALTKHSSEASFTTLVAWIMKKLGIDQSILKQDLAL